MKLALTVEIQLEVLQTLATPHETSFEKTLQRLYSEKKWEELSKPLLDHCVAQFIKLEKGEMVSAQVFIDKHNNRDCPRPIMFNVAEKEQFVYALQRRLLDVNLIDIGIPAFNTDRFSTNPNWVRN